MFHLKAVFRAILVLERYSEFAARRNVFQSGKGDAVVFLHLVVVVLIAEGKGKHALLLQISLVYAGKTLGENHFHVKEARFHSSMFARRTFAIVVFSHHDAANALSLVGFGCSRNFNIFARELVLHLVALTVEGIDGTHEEVVRYILEVSTELEPWSGHGNVIGSTLAFRLDEQRHVYEVFAIPWGEWCEFLQAVAVWRDDNLYASILVTGSNKSLVLHGKPLGREGMS